MLRNNIESAEELMEVIREVGFLPLLPNHIKGFSAEEIVSPDCRYVVLDDGGWEWQVWKWKGPIIQLGECVYGKFFDKKAGYVSMEWWQDFMNYRRSLVPVIAEDSIEQMILETLQLNGSMITRDLRARCAFNGKNMRSKFDAYVTRLQMQCRIVTEDFVYPLDRHGKQYGWGWSLLTTPEQLLGSEACMPPIDIESGMQRSPEQSFQRIIDHLATQLPFATKQQLVKLIN